ncbi:helix-turn-helix domain-containing protein [Microbacterium sp. bgisy189]|uniref:helix-turn-helix domain-containing protein n=1 Tax=Microbacterium sp. bgisy189 TaxID=3413798 RepID=UPI003EBD84B1
MSDLRREIEARDAQHATSYWFESDEAIDDLVDAYERLQQNGPSSEISSTIRLLREQTTLTIAQTALVLGIDEQHARQFIESGEIETLRIGRTVRVLTQPLARLLGDTCSHCGRIGGES